MAVQFNEKLVQTIMKTNQFYVVAVLAVILGIPLSGYTQTFGWTNRFDGPANNNDVASAITLDARGHVFVTGSSYGSFENNSDYATIKYSNAGVPLWTNRYNGPGSFTDQANGLAVDADGNLYVTGGSRGESNTDYATIAYSNAGVALWTNRYNGSGNGSDQANDIAVDCSGNVFVTGYSFSGSTYNYATLAYSSAGVLLWTNHYNGPANGDDFASALAVDTNGNVFATGYSSSGSNNDYATVAYSNAGVPLWTNRYNGPGNLTDQASAIAVDASGNVFVTGYSSSSGSTSDYATIKYSNAGVPLWTNRYNGPGNLTDQASAIAVDASGNVFVTGYSSGSGSTFDYATIKYSNAGVPLWTNRYDGPTNDRDYAVALAVDSSGNIYVTGHSFGSFGINGSGYDYATIKYSSAGVALWTNRYNGPVSSGDYATALGVDANGNVFVTGSSNSTAASSNPDYATIKYAAGTPWLAISTSGENVTISWPSSVNNFLLQQNSDIANTNGWSNYAGMVNDNGTNKSITILPSNEGQFFRLKN